MNLTTAGCVFNFQHGAYAPEGKIEGQPSQEEIDSHNRRLAQREIEAMKQAGRGVLYLFYEEFTQSMDNGSGLQPIKCRKTFVGTWASKSGERFPVHYLKRSFHNFAGRDGRIDLWFRFDGSLWHGVNIGDNDIVRCKRTKGR